MAERRMRITSRWFPRNGAVFLHTSAGRMWIIELRWAVHPRRWGIGTWLYNDLDAGQLCVQLLPFLAVISRG